MGAEVHPARGLVHQVNEFFGLIWDEAEELSRLARQSRPKVSIDTGGLAPEQTALANRLAQTIRRLPPDSVAAIHAILDAVPPPVQRRGTQAITTGRSGLGRKLNSSRNGLPRDTVHPAYSPASSWYSAAMRLQRCPIQPNLMIVELQRAPAQTRAICRGVVMRQAGKHQRVAGTQRHGDALLRMHVSADQWCTD